MVVGIHNNAHLMSNRIERENLVRNFKTALVKQAFREGFDVIVDDTHLVPQTVRKLHRLAESIGDVKVIEKCFNVPVAECLRRNALREGPARVPDKVINDMARAAGLDKGRMLEDRETYHPPVGTQGTYVPDERLPKAVMCDLDGTLALIGDRSPYDATACDAKDSPNPAVAACVMAMHAQSFKIVFMSGRDVRYRPETERFIEKHCHVVLPDGARDAMPYELHMRGEDDASTQDSRKDAVVKQELFDRHVRHRFNVVFVLDDRDSVVRLWRDIGVPCFQTSYGDF